MKQALLQATLQEIEEIGSSEQLNLRQVARRAGCAHTNVYNHFEGVAGLQWAALDEALHLLVGSCSAAAEREREVRARFEAVLDRYVSFALEHPAWYRLVWLDVVDPPSHADAQLLRLPETLIRHSLSGVLALEPEADAARQATEQVHGYLHGALMKLIGGRHTWGTVEDARSDIFAGVDRLVEGLLAR